ncbi:MAG TPA: hypothetical protein V6C97_14940 [Oculatellaceae cyanobacterium]
MNFIFCSFCRFRIDPRKRVCSTCGQPVAAALSNSSKRYGGKPSVSVFRKFLSTYFGRPLEKPIAAK